MTADDIVDLNPSDERLGVAKAANAGPSMTLMVPSGIASPALKRQRQSVPCRHAGCNKECATTQAEANHAKSCMFGKPSQVNPPRRHGAAPHEEEANPNHTDEDVADYVEIDIATPGKQFFYKIS